MYQDEKWSGLIEALGLNKDVTQENLVKLEFNLASAFKEGKVQMSRTVELVESLISELDCKKFKAQIEEISEAKFITSFY